MEKLFFDTHLKIEKPFWFPVMINWTELKLFINFQWAQMLLLIFSWRRKDFLQSNSNHLKFYESF